MKNGKMAVMAAALWLLSGMGSLYAASAIANKVYDFMPAPGQFINTLPAYEDGDDSLTMLAKVEERLKADEMVCLGGFGGYVVVGFDHTVVNKADTVDFLVKGNAFAGSAEPGVIQVMADTNKDKLPNDTWYEIKGDAHDSLRTVFNYRIVYKRPGEDNRIPWSDNLGNRDTLEQNAFHKQCYYPLWTNRDSLVFVGTRLPPNGYDQSGKGTYWLNPAFGFGYADNLPNTDPMAAIDINWAVDADGNPANLPGIDFVRVYTGKNQVCGWLGENSTEITAVIDLHPEVGVTEYVAESPKVRRSGEYLYGVPEASDLYVYSLSGQRRACLKNVSGVVRLPVTGKVMIIKIVTRNQVITVK